MSKFNPATFMKPFGARLWFVGFLVASIAAGDEPQQSRRAIDLSSICGRSGATTVPAGSHAEAEAYYRGLSTEIGFKMPDTIRGATLDDVFVFMGYEAKSPAAPLHAADVQNADPADLIDAAAFGNRLGGLPISAGDVLSARFFAPKISDVSGEKVTDAGWRKLVRFRARSASTAQQHGIASAFVLFNFFADINSTQPFTNADSVNTQVILISTRPGFSPVYWLDFGPTAPGARLIDSPGAKINDALDAFFDAGHVPASLTKAQGGKRSYFVPCACISCHGGLQLNTSVRPPAPMAQFDKALLDYLDTDHWLDRIQTGDDFAGLASPTVLDGVSGFEIIRKINGEIAEQNATVQPGSVQHRAAQHWLELHQTNSGYVSDLIQRALVTPGKPSWSASNPDDRAFLPKLNRFCFRCHGSVEFDVFDKSLVVAEKLKLKSVLRPRTEATAKTGDPRFSMPPDRDLNDADLKALRQFVQNLH